MSKFEARKKKKFAGGTKIGKKAAVILGNGPSLTGFDFEKLNGFDTFGMNAAYRYWKEIQWYPKYYSCLDIVVGLSHKAEIRGLIENAHIYGISAFLLRDNLISQLGEVQNIDRVTSFDQLRKRNRALATNPLSTGSHTTAWAVLLGYQNIFLIGIDCNYIEKVEGACEGRGTEMEIISQHKNPNYFFEGYQKPGDKYTVPNPAFDVHTQSWEVIAHAFRNSPALILNANLRSQMMSFDFCKIEDLSSKSEAKIIPKESFIEEHSKKGYANHTHGYGLVKRPFYANFADGLKENHQALYWIGKKILNAVRRFDIF